MNKNLPAQPFLKEAGKMEHSDTINKLSEALCKAQKNFKTAFKNCENPYFHSKYADYAEILRCVKPALNAEGISILQPIKEDVVETVLLHESGEFISSTTKIYNVSNKPQDYGSAITYARRYALSAILSVDSDDDDDGNRANGNGNQPNKQVTKPVDPNRERIIKINKFISQLFISKKFTNESMEKYLGYPIEEITKRLDETEKKLKALVERK